ncbi:MAG: RHS repeat-associated core domain-containing protein, partial [Bacteroides sp.]
MKDVDQAFSISDIFSRVVLEGTCKSDKNFSITAERFSDSLLLAEPFLPSTENKGYRILLDQTPVALSNVIFYKANYYDNYDFLGTNGFPAVTDTNFAYKSLSPYGERYTASAKGLLTGIITARLNDGTIPSYDYTVKYYDERSRVVQEKSTNHLDGYDQTYFAYNFVDQPIKMQHVHSAKSKLTQTERYTYTYDHAGRLMTTKHQLNGVPETLLVNNSYDELGRLQSNQRNGQANLKTNYTYNIRSWMKT